VRRLGTVHGAVDRLIRIMPLERRYTLLTTQGNRRTWPSVRTLPVSARGRGDASRG
jgi:hypothetical protein